MMLLKILLVLALIVIGMAGEGDDILSQYSFHTNAPMETTTMRTEVEESSPDILDTAFESNNVTTQNTTNSTPINPSMIVVGIATVITSLTTVCGNILVLSSFFIERSLRSATNYFIVSLAITDILIGIFSMNLFSYYIIMDKWILSTIACDLWLALDYTACLTSQYTVFLITVDRYASVRIPAKYRNWRTESKILCGVIITWIVPTVVFFTLIFGWKSFYPDYDRDVNKCEAPFSEDPTFMTILTICYFWITLLVMCYLYVGIYRVAASLQKKADSKRQKLTSLFSMAGQTMSRIGVSLPNDNLSSTNGIESYSCSKFNANSVQTTCSDKKPITVSQPAKEIIEDDCSSYNCFPQPYSCENDQEKIELYPTAFSQKHPVLQPISSPILYENNEGESGSFVKRFSLRVKFEKPSDSLCNNMGKTTQDLASIENSSSSSPIWKAKPSENNSLHSDLQNEDGTDSCENPLDNIKRGSKSLRQIANRNQTNISCQLLTNRPKKSFKSEVLRKFNMKFTTRVKHEKIQRGRNENRARKALRTISFILGAFVVCWTPYHIVVLIEAYYKNSVNIHIYYLSYWLCYMNSPINPFCYALANAQFKKTFLRILTCDLHKS